ncbi:GNAT family N-acetyltransferase [Rhizobacter sp. AJA081-3]|uniref:GNAT family N-acetyltransferase n=1 Tax=Rhizobacter sp. AJA081-3 TaxID=2753607 RepID=UPI001BB62E94|nr:GNAT family N-acetyltransferase [Rhizobacter sp. AJA081-3]QTN23166.1 GNAT family N-acetyltransferase [Rhizobacter sp. AJA081-3]
MPTTLTIRPARPEEFEPLGRLTVAVYAALPGFPTPAQQPGYYEMLAGIGRFAERPGACLLVAHSAQGELAGGVVYFGDMAEYGAGGIAASQRDAAGIRLLAVAPAHRGLGAGRALTQACIERARAEGRSEVILHTTRAMQRAWALYEAMGFLRSADLDFEQQSLPVYGFRMSLG